MALSRDARLSFNRGIVSQLAAARFDLERLRLSAEEMTNFVPRVLGSMMLRPGLGYTGASAGNAFSKSIPFLRSVAVMARLEFTASGLRVWKVDDQLVTRLAVTAAVTNGLFDANVNNWTDSDESGGVSAWAAGGYLSLLGNGTAAAIRDQQVTVNEANVEHALRIVIAAGAPVSFQVGSTSGGDEYVTETVLGEGTHSIAFTPTGNFHIRFFNHTTRIALVDSVAVEAAGVMVLPTPWAVNNLPSLRFTQSADVTFLASDGFQQREVQRRGDTSWSIVKYVVDNGPFRLLNTTPITIAANAISGNVTLTASKKLFRAGHVGALFRLISAGQLVSVSISAENTFTDPIRVIGVGGQRSFSILLTGTWSATVKLQQSIGAPGSWVDVETFTANAAVSYNDELDEQIVYYRIGVKTGGYVSGSVSAILSYSSGTTTGIVRITAVASSISASAEVIEQLGAANQGTADWYEGSWSDYRGWTTALALHEGRLCWLGRDKFYGSESDLYISFDDTVEGDAGPIQRSIGEGPIEKIHWAMSLSRLIIGTAANSADIAPVRIDGDSPLEARSSSFDEPLTPTNFNLKFASSTGVYVDRSRTRLYELAFNVDNQAFKPEDLTQLVPDLNEVGIAGIAVQYKPDLRIHCWRTDGTVGLLVFNRTENVICWCEVETDGVVEDVCILPDAVEDRVYYTVQRTIGVSTVRYHERWALESECEGGTLNKQADAFLVFTSASPTSTITGASHLAGEIVVVWGGGRDLGTFTVASNGTIALGAKTVTQAVYGLGYRARWRGTKNTFGDAMGVPLSRPVRLVRLGLMLRDSHGQGLRYGQDFEHLNDLPQDDLPDLNNDPETKDLDYIWAEHEMRDMSVDGHWGTDSHLCLEANAPRPCTVLAAVIELEGG